MMLANHLGGVCPPRPAFFSDDGLSIKLAGRPMIGETPNPGSPRGGDPAYAPKLRRLFGTQCRIVYVAGSHTGEITRFPRQENVLAKPEAGITAVKGDAVVIDYGRLQSHRRPLVAVLKTCDCANLALVSKYERRLVLMHGSVMDQWNYGNQPNFRGPIFDRSMSFFKYPDKVHILAGPSADGTDGQPDNVEPHWTYEWDTPDADKLWDNIRHVTPSLALDGLRRERPESGKTDVAFGRLWTRLFEAYGFTPYWGYDASYNHCTITRSDIWYSMRVARKAKHDPFISDAKRITLRQEERHRYGNLLIAHLS